MNELLEIIEMLTKKVAELEDRIIFLEHSEIYEREQRVNRRERGEDK